MLSIRQLPHESEARMGLPDAVGACCWLVRALAEGTPLPLSCLSLSRCFIHTELPTNRHSRQPALTSIHAHFVAEADLADGLLGECMGELRGETGPSLAEVGVAVFNSSCLSRAVYAALDSSACTRMDQSNVHSTPG